jgi:hypothetical protein
MRAAACAGDDSTFFAHVAGSLYSRWEGTGELREWRDEIRKAEKSNICSVFSHKVWDDYDMDSRSKGSAAMTLKINDLREVSLRFERSGRHLYLVDMGEDNLMLIRP